jgi:hypothetical protein
LIAIDKIAAGPPERAALFHPTANQKGAELNSNDLVYPGLTLRSGYRGNEQDVPEWFNEPRGCIQKEGGLQAETTINSSSPIL